MRRTATIIVVTAGMTAVFGIVSGAASSEAEPYPTCWASDGSTPPPTLVGTAGSDVLIGTAGDDLILGLAGDDVIHAGAANDVVCGSEGADTIHGGAERDVLDGADIDLLKLAESGEDTEDGPDHLFGGLATMICSGWRKPTWCPMGRATTWSRASSGPTGCTADPATTWW